MALGDPIDDATIVGCLVNEQAADAAMAVIEEARAAGARVLCGGTRLGPTQRRADAARRRADDRAGLRGEVFAPIVAIATYDDVDAAIAAAGEHGLRPAGGHLHE